MCTLSHLFIDCSNEHSLDSSADIPRREVPETLTNRDAQADQEEGTRDDVTLPHRMLGLVLHVVYHGTEAVVSSKSVCGKTKTTFQ